MDPKRSASDSCFEKLPLIVRARGYRLYDRKGNRYIDLFRDGGRNLFGHRPKGLTKQLKNILEKGLGSSLPSVYQNRLINQLKILFPDYPYFTVFESPAHALDALTLLYKQKITRKDIIDPLHDSAKNKTGISCWRPFCSLNQETDILIPILPFSYGTTTTIVCSKMKIENSANYAASPFVLTGLLHAAALIKSTPVPLWIYDEIPEESAMFIKRGIYLLFKETGRQYKPVFNQFLENGYLLPPSFSTPGILPFEISPGEKNILLELLSLKKL